MKTQNTKPAHIRVIALCVVRRGERILVFEGYDSRTGAYFYRPLGGGVEPGETTLETVAREITEELGLQAVDLKLLGILENLFVLEGKPKHEIVYAGSMCTATSEMFKLEVSKRCFTR